MGAGVSHFSTCVFGYWDVRSALLKPGAGVGHPHPMLRKPAFSHQTWTRCSCSQACSGGSHRWSLLFPGEQKRPGSSAAMEQYQKRDPKSHPLGCWVWSMAPVWTGGLCQGMLNPRKSAFTSAATEHCSYTQIWKPSMNV